MVADIYRMHYQVKKKKEKKESSISVYIIILFAAVSHRPHSSAFSILSLMQTAALDPQIHVFTYISSRLCLYECVFIVFTRVAHVYICVCA